MSTVPPSVLAPQKYRATLEVSIPSLKVSTKLPQAQQRMWSPSLHWQTFPQKWSFSQEMELPAQRMNSSYRQRPLLSS